MRRLYSRYLKIQVPGMRSNTFPAPKIQVTGIDIFYSCHLKIQVLGIGNISSRYHGRGNREHSLPAPIYKYIPIGRECAGTHPYSVGRMSTPPHTGGSPPSTTAKCKEKRKFSNLKR